MAKQKKRKGPSNRSGRRSPEPVVRDRPQRRRWPVGLIAVAVVGVAVVGYQLVRSPVAQSFPAAIDLPPGAGTGFNVLLITIDTLRSDHVGCYGYRGAKTPALDALAAGGVRFADAVTPVPTTLPAHASILTGEYPPRHGVRNNGTYRLAEERETLAERLRANGYATAAFISAFVLDRRYGLGQGFDVYDDQIAPQHGTSGSEQLNPQRPGNIVTDSAVRWLAEHQQANPGQQFFAWIHFFDPHTPYSPPEPFQTQYASRPYDGEVAFADQQVGRLVAKLRELDLLDKTIIAAVGDHGEGLGDHGESTHGLLIYGSTMRVPLILYAPALLPEGKVVDDRVVSTVDIGPTILDLLGLDARRCDGESQLRAPADQDRAVYLETLAPNLNHGWSPLHGLRRRRDKYIEAPAPEYYDLSADAAEGRNLWAERAEEADALADRLAELMESFGVGQDAETATVALDQEAINKLASLGYFVGRAAPATASLADPKDMVARLDRLMGRASVLIAQKRHGEAIPLIKQLLATTPEDASLWSLLSVAQIQASLLDEAIVSRAKSTSLQPNDPNGWLLLANLQYVKGDLEAWRGSLAEAERLEPEFGEVFVVRARHALYTGHYEDAVALCREARKRDPTRCAGKSWSLQGDAYDQMGKVVEAETAYARAHEIDPGDVRALLGLARGAQRQGRSERVIQLGSLIPRGRSEWAQSRTMLANAYIGLGRGDQAIQVMTEWVEAAPNHPGAHNNLGSVFLRLGRLSEAAACYRKALEIDPSFPEAHTNLARLRGMEAGADQQGRDTP